MCFRRAVRHHVFSQELTRKRSGPGGQRLFGGSDFSRHITCRIFAVFDWEQRFASQAIKQEDEALLRSLRHRVHFLAITLHSYERRGGREITVPHIVPDSLKMPQALAGFSVQRNLAVSEEVIAGAITAIKIECC